MRARYELALWVALSAGLAIAQPWSPVRTAPAYDRLTPYLGLPPAFEERLLYYNGFEQPDGKPEVSQPEIVQSGKLTAGGAGIYGQCGIPDSRQVLSLRSEDFSPHLPLSVSFWWALQEDAQLESCFGLFHLSGGKGFVSHFSRGKGEWCALERPAAVLQVYYLPGIANLNGIYDTDLMAHVELKAGVWHHTALVFSGSSLIEVYTEGQRVFQHRLKGRSFTADDALGEMSIGSRGLPVALDELVILRRALAAEEVESYVAGLRAMGEIGYGASNS